MGGWSSDDAPELRDLHKSQTFDAAVLACMGVNLPNCGSPKAAIQ